MSDSGLSKDDYVFLPELISCQLCIVDGFFCCVLQSSTSICIEKLLTWTTTFQEKGKLCYRSVTLPLSISVLKFEPDVDVV